MTLKGGGVLYPYNTQGQIVLVKNDVLVFPMVNNYYGPVYYDVAFDEETGEREEEKPEPEVFNGLIIADLSDPDAPEVVTEFPIEFSGTSGYFAKDDVVYFSYKEYMKNENPERPEAQYYLGRVDISDPSDPELLASINIPGTCVGMDAQGTYAYTTDSQWGPEKDDYSQLYSFRTVKIEGDKAFLADSVDLDTYFYNFVIADGLAYLSGGYWWGYSGSLMVIDLGDPENLTVYKNKLSGGGNVIGAKKRKVFATTSGGIACYDSSDPGKLRLDEFRSQGVWYNRIVFTDSDAYMPMGYYGMWSKSL